MSSSERRVTGRDSIPAPHKDEVDDAIVAVDTGERSGQILPENYRSCLDAIPDLMALKGEELEYLFVNKAFCRIAGRSQGEILKKREIDIFPKDIARRLETMDLLVLASLKESVEEVTIDGRIYEVRKFPVNLQDRGLVVMSGRDITERRESETALLTEKIRFQIISDNVPVAMILLDEQGTVKYLNTTFGEIFAYDMDDVPDGATWFKRAFPDEEYESFVASVISRPDEVSGWKGRTRNTLTAIRRDGTRRLISLEARQLVSGDVVVSCDELSEQLKNESTAIRDADYDSITGLPNRPSLERAVKIVVARANERRKRRALSAILFLTIHDFDGLKKTYGTDSGDEILTTFARLLRSILREGDIAYRSGEDRFAVVFKGISMAEAMLAAERIHQALRNFTFLTGSRSLLLTIVVALVPVEGAQDASAILAAGEGMAEEAKIPNLNRILVYEPERKGPGGL
jgi:diguanylate cyclase (GGDEF)-like protein/PAS domain S-box-containing protein